MRTVEDAPPAPRRLLRPAPVPVPRVVAPATALAAVLAAAYLLAPAMGTDLSAQVAHADFWRQFGATPVDLRWYGGSEQFGYSLVAPAVMAALGVRPTGALALVGSAAAFGWLLVRCRVPRPLLGGLVGAVCIAGNLVSGRITWALGVAFGLLALALLAGPPATSAARPDAVAAGPAGLAGARSASPGGAEAGGRGGSVAGAARWQWWGAGVAALLASAASPVAGLFLGLVAAALLLSAPVAGWRRLTGRVRDGLLLGTAAAVPLLVTSVLFGSGGWMNTGRTDTVHAIVASLVVAVLVPRRVVRVGALLAALGVLLAALVHTPVGLNATRLVVMFGLPVVAAAAALPESLNRRITAPAGSATGTGRGRYPGWPGAGAVVGAAALVAVLAVGWWWQPPLLVNDLRDRGNPTSDRAYFAPLLAQLAARGVSGRVEIPPTRDYWESAYLDPYPLARGWLRQVDIARNPLFFAEIPGDGGTEVPLTPAAYRAWLAENAVQWVAVADTPLSWVGRPEAALIGAGLPYLREVWREGPWRLYAVAAPTPLVAAPAQFVAQDPAHLTFSAPAAGDILVRLRWSRRLTVTGGATLQPDSGANGWTRVRVPAAGAYTLGSSLTR